MSCSRSRNRVLISIKSALRQKWQFQKQVMGGLIIIILSLTPRNTILHTNV